MSLTNRVDDSTKLSVGKMMDRQVEHHEALAWHETANEVRDDWIACRLTHKAASAFTDWAIARISKSGHVVGIDPETGDSADEASRMANAAYEAAWIIFCEMELSILSLSASSAFGGDDQSTVRRMLLDTEHQANDDSRRRRLAAGLLRDELGVPMSCYLSKGPG